MVLLKVKMFYLPFQGEVPGETCLLLHKPLSCGIIRDVYKIIMKPYTNEVSRTFKFDRMSC